MDFQYQLKRLKHWLISGHRKGHGIHSPFLYEFVTDVIFSSNNKSAAIQLTEYPGVINALERKLGNLIYRILLWQNKPNVFEICYLPTNRSLYLFNRNSIRPSIVNHECSHELEKMERFVKSKQLPIDFMLGDVEYILPKLLNARTSFDVLVVSINKQYMGEDWFLKLINEHVNATSILLINNLHRSENTAALWRKLKTESRARVFLDLFHVGIVFFHEELQKEEFVVRF